MTDNVRPQFVIAGWLGHDGQVILAASQHVDELSMSIAPDLPPTYEAPDEILIRPTVRGWCEVTGKAQRVGLVVAADFAEAALKLAEAMRQLDHVGGPDDPTRATIPFPTLGAPS